VENFVARVTVPVFALRCVRRVFSTEKSKQAAGIEEKQEQTSRGSQERVSRGSLSAASLTFTAANSTTMSHHPIDGVEHPHAHDVLSGRGNFVNYHAGNEHFRALVRKHKVAYVACPKPQKAKYSKMIVDEIRSLNPPGRFLKQDPRTKLWVDIGEKKALDKTRQALREGAPDIMKELTTDGDDGDDNNNSSDEGEKAGEVRSVSCRNVYVFHTAATFLVFVLLIRSVYVRMKCRS